MLRLCSRKVLDLAKLAAVGSSALQNSAKINGEFPTLLCDKKGLLNQILSWFLTAHTFLYLTNLIQHDLELHQPDKSDRIFTGSVAARSLSTVPSTTTTDSPVSTTIDEPWISIEDWSYAWYDGRDKLHVKMKATGDSTEWRGVGFYSKGEE